AAVSSLYIMQSIYTDDNKCLERGCVDLIDVLWDRKSRVNHAVGTIEGNVAADCATNQRGDDKEINLLRHHGVLQSLANRRLRNNRYVEHKQDHDGTQRRDDAVQRDARLLGQENEDCDGSRQYATDARVDAQHRVEPQSRASDVADIKDHAADEDQDGQEPSES